MSERSLHGVPASPGVALGAGWRRPEQIRTGELVASEDRPAERDTALAALAAAAAELTAVAADLSPDEAEIVEASALMAQDPALLSAVEEAILHRGLPAGEAILSACGDHADLIAAIGDETLAARADDVGSLGRRAARLAGRGGVDAAPEGDVVLIADDLGPADVAELADSLAGIALAGGGFTAHAAIVARSLGVPMVTGLGEQLRALADGTPIVIDGSSGSLTLRPTERQSRVACGEMESRRMAMARALAQRDQPAVTRDGRRVTVLANVASPAELDVGLRAGAEGVGLLRTELAFLEAVDWPTERQHADALEPILVGLGGRRAVVRVLDFGADKSPPFLRHVRQRGLELLLCNADAFISQLRAILMCARERDVRILLPMVNGPEQLTAARTFLEHAARPLDVEQLPPVGSMIETPGAAGQATAIAGRSEFLSIGTNDLTAATLGADRFAANDAHAHAPRVLRLIDASVTAAHQAGIAIEVCGEAASDPVMAPLLVGLGVDELSVGAARVGVVREWVRRLDAAQAGEIARAALTMESAEQVEAAAGPLAMSLRGAEVGSVSVQTGNGRGERVERSGRVHALGA
jgi:phosphoenolpyruvate-protein kinase (PTS system EI component)